MQFIPEIILVLGCLGDFIEGFQLFWFRALVFFVFCGFHRRISMVSELCIQNSRGIVISCVIVQQSVGRWCGESQRASGRESERVIGNSEQQHLAVVSCSQKHIVILSNHQQYLLEHLAILITTQQHSAVVSRSYDLSILLNSTQQYRANT